LSQHYNVFDFEYFLEDYDLLDYNVKRPRAFSQKQKRWILEDQDYECLGNEIWEYECGKQLNICTGEFHHQWPYAVGGVTEEWNGIALCKPCHRDITTQGNTKWMKIR